MTWTKEANIKGPQGDPGLRGSIWRHAVVPPTDRGAEALSPAPHGGWLKDDMWLITEGALRGHTYVYSGTSWSDEGVNIRGAQGPPGAKGDTGDAAAIATWGDLFPGHGTIDYTVPASAALNDEPST